MNPLRVLLNNRWLTLLKSKLKHLLHCTILLTLIINSHQTSTNVSDTTSSPSHDPWVEYGTPLTLYLYLIRYLTLIAVPVTIMQFLGLVCFNVFPEAVKLRASPLSAPFICVRVVTRGDFPQLVRENVARNMGTCIDAGLTNFQIEVATDRAINLAPHKRIRELVVPPTYRSETGALFKARALQYCLEDGVNTLSDAEWIVHLDEETILTENSVRGILNFVMEGKHSFGQGLITYASQEVVNWVTTLADSMRVADDLGKVRGQFKIFHKPIFSWKGSYVVSQVAAERSVSYDHGPDGSVAEDCFFALKAFEAGYTFDFIDGEMWEKSPFTFADFLQQRKRWLQGIYLVVNSKDIPLRYKLGVGSALLSWITMPLTTSNMFLVAAFPVQSSLILEAILKFVGTVTIYLYVIGAAKSFSMRRYGMIRCTFCVFGALCTIPVTIVIENIALVWGLLSSKHTFYIVNKEIRSTSIV